MWVNKDKCKPHMMLDIGSGNPDQGEVQPKGYVLNDVEPHKNIDLVCNIKDLIQFVPEGYCKEVRASHVLEHFTKSEVVEVVKDVYKMLEPGGLFRIFVPNFRWHAELVQKGLEEQAVHYAFGGQLDEYDLHKTAFTPKLLTKLLEENGFSIEGLVDGTSISCVGLKVC